MNRIEFMTRLEALLQNIELEERKEAMQYYNDYFDDAGTENESHVIQELGSPEKVAIIIKSGLGGKNEEHSEYGETGYTDTRFEEKEMPAKKGTRYDYEESLTSKLKGNSNIWKIIAIILLICFGVPIVVPIVAGIFAAVIGLAVGLLGLVVGLAAGAVGVAIGGIVCVVFGIVQVFISGPVSIGFIGIGFVMLAVGSLATVCLVKLALKVVPVVVNGVINIIRNIVHKRRV